MEDFFNDDVVTPETEEKFLKVVVSDRGLTRDVLESGVDEWRVKVQNYGTVTFRAVRNRLTAEVPEDAAHVLATIPGYAVEGLPLAQRSLEGLVDDFNLKAERDALERERKLATARTANTEVELLRDTIRQQQEAMLATQKQMSAMMEMFAQLQQARHIPSPELAMTAAAPSTEVVPPTPEATVVSEVLEVAPTPAPSTPSVKKTTQAKAPKPS